MRIEIQHKSSKGQGLSELVFKKDKFNEHKLFTTRPIELPHGDYLFFDGMITNYPGYVEDFFKGFFRENSIQDLVELSTFWDGAWALIYINQNGTTYCFTDPLGKKQIYYDTAGNFATNIWSLRSSAMLDDLDPLYLGEIHKWGYNVDDLTPFKNIKRIKPGRLYMFMGGELQYVSKEYPAFGEYPPVLTPRNEEEDSEEIRYLVNMAIYRYLRGIPGEEKDIAILLSGGIDSSVIAYELLRSDLASGKNLKFYTINNREDAPFVNVFKNAFDIEVETLSYDMQNIDLERALRINETPVDLGSMVPNQLMFEAIPEKIIFTGDGPDELFGGYNRIDDYDSQKSDVFHELSYYHLPRLEKAAQAFGKDLRCPWLSYSIVDFALDLPYERRKHKSCIKNAYRGILPDLILDRPKLPLKNDELRADPMAYRKKLISIFKTICDNENC